MIGIRRFSSGIFGLVFILALFGCISEVDVSEPMELRLAAWNIRIMSDKSRTDTELKQIAKTIADYDFIAIVELRDEMVLQRTQKILSQMGQMYDYEFSPAVGGGVKERYAFLYKQNLVSVVRKGELYPDDADGRRSIDELVNWHRRHYGNPIASKRPLFPSRHKSGTVPMHRQTAHAILKDAFIEAGLNGHLATHSLRKSFAQRLYDKTGDIYMVQELLGHRNISTTQKYLGVNYADAKAAVELIALMSESDRTTLSSRSLKDIDDETLRSELAKRGYNVTRREVSETTAEIVKIG